MAVRHEIHFGNRLVRTYEQRPSSLVDILRASAERMPDRLAIADDRHRLDYRRLWELALAFGQLPAIRRLPRGSRVLMSIGNCAEFPIVFFGCIAAGLVPIPVGGRLRRPELAYIARDSEAAAAVFERDVTEHLPTQDDLGRPFCRIVVPDDFDISAPAGLPQVPPGPTAEPGEDDGACMLYTSGTTGRPKGAILAHLNLVHSALHWKAMLELKEGDVTALAIPASHVAAIGGVIVPFLALGGTIHFVREFNAGALLRLVASERINHTLLVPAMYNLCLRTEEIGTLDLAHWQLGVFGGAPMPVPTIERYNQLLPGLAMRNAYGATETASPATITRLRAEAPPHDSVGQVVECGTIIVVDEDGREVAPGETGELLIGGPMVIPGYWNNAEANAASFVDGYWRSGDIGSVDAEGYVRVFDRKKDMINRGGYKVYPAEVESVIQGLRAVVEAAVIGYAHDVLGEKAHAIINSSSADLSAEAVLDHCSRLLADYKVPDRVTIVHEPLPRNANGKLQKSELRKLYGEPH